MSWRRVRSNGQQSAFAFTQQLQSANGITVITRVGAISAGRFAGANAIETLTGASLDLTACATTGITAYSFQAVLSIVGA